MTAPHHFQFNEVELLALPLPATGWRATYHDTKAPGLQTRATSTGAKTFNVYRRTEDGGPELVTLGRFPRMTVERARKAASTVNAEIENGANPAQAECAFREEPTPSILLDEYGERKLSWSDDRQRFRSDLQKPLGGRKRSTITQAMIARILSDAEKAGKAPATVRQIRALASSVFAKAIEGGYLEANPAQGVKVAGKTVSRDRFLQADELPRFFAALGEERNVATRDFILLAVLTGAGRANLCAMHWRELDLTTGVWRIPTTKNGEPQSVTLCPEAVEILSARQEETTAGGFVFPTNSPSGHFSGTRGTACSGCSAAPAFPAAATSRTASPCTTCGARWVAGRQEPAPRWR